MTSNGRFITPHQSPYCPVTGLPITSKPEWTDFRLDSDYTVTFSIIGNAILLTTARGQTTHKGIKCLLEKVSEIIHEAGLSGKKYVELKDYSRLTNIPPRSVRMTWSDYMLKEATKGYLQGLWVFGASTFLRLAFQAGAKIYKPPIPLSVVKDYPEAIRSALTALRQKGVEVGEIIHPSLTKNDWSLEIEGYGISFELIGDDILYTIAHGSLKEPDVEKFFQLHEKVLQEAGIYPKGYFYRIINWERYERSSWQVRRMYIARMKELNKRITCKLTVIFGLNPFMKALAEASKPFMPSPVLIANDLQNALAIIENEREIRDRSAEKSQKHKEKIFTEAQVKGFAEEILEVLGELNWQQVGLSVDDISDEHPLKSAFDALAVIKLDLDELLREKEKSQKSLQESETRFTSIFNAQQNGIIIIDPETHRIVDLNASALHMIGAAREDALGRECHKYVCPTEKGKCPITDLQMNIDNTERVLIKTDHTKIPILKSVSLLTLGGKDFLIESFIDISVRKKAEDALKESEEKYRNILESIEDGYFEVDLAGNFTFFNASMCTIIGYPGEEMPGMNYRKFMDETSIKRVFNAFNEVYKTGVPSKGFEWYIIRKDGARRHLEVSVSLIADAGRGAIGFRGIARDFSERKVIELELEKHRDHLEEMIKERTVELTRTTNFLTNIINSSIDGIITTDIEGTVLHASPRIKDILGYEQHEVMGKKVHTLFAQGNEESEKILNEVMKKGGVRGCELRSIRKSGEPTVLNLSMSLLREEKGNIIGTTSIYRDITEEKRMEEAMKQAMLRAELANKAKGQFIANMSHEIRTPLNGILGMADLCLETNLDGEQRRLVNTINREGLSLLQIVNEVLDFAKIEAGKVKIERIPFDLRNLLEDMTEISSYRTAQKGLTFSSYILPGVPTRLMGDPGRLRQVLRNLIDNAIKFTHEGGIDVKADLAEDMRDGIKVRFLVKDTGIGIPKDKQSIIFESFTQADGSTTRKYGGTGLGITISKQMAELMGGTLGVDSEEGKGSTFWFTAVFTRQSETGSPKRKEVSLIDVRVLVVDDSKSNCHLLSEYLRSWGSVPVEAVSAKEALSILKKSIAERERFNLVLSDFNMPEMDGFDLAREIRRQEPFRSIPIIIITGYGTPGDGKICREIGIDGYLTKPFQESDLRRTIEIVLDSSMCGERAGKIDLVTRHSTAEMDRKDFRILLAEDYPTNQEIAKRYLVHAGYQVDIVEDGKQALEAFKRRHYDLILMDIQMPIMDGFQATAAIRKLETERITSGNEDVNQTTQRVPIIAMTAHAMEEHQKLCLEAGMDDFLSKPISKKGLLSMVEKWIQSFLKPSLSPKPSRHLPSEDGQYMCPAEARTGKSMDLERALEEFEGDRDTLSEVIEGFTKKVAEQIGTMRKALSCGDAETIRKEAHSIKGGGANLTAEKLSKIASELESKGKNNDLDGAGEIVNGLESELAALALYVQENFPKLGEP